MESLFNIKITILMVFAAIFPLTLSLISNNIIFFGLGELLTGVVGLPYSCRNFCLFGNTI